VGRDDGRDAREANGRYMRGRANGRKHILPTLLATSGQSVGSGSETVLSRRCFLGDHAGHGGEIGSLARHLPATVGDELQRFIRAGMALPFDWVSNNCGFWVCDWIKIKRGIDPVRRLRGRFRDAFAFIRYVETHGGGNEAFSRKIAAAANLKETLNPRRGDIGLVATPSGAAMAICIGDGRWAGKSQHGVVISEYPVIVAWRV
jgi:hypothetical protein